MEKINFIPIKPFKNAYCDAIDCALGGLFEIDEEFKQRLIKNLSQEEIETICDYAALKNKLAGVQYVNLKVPCVRKGKQALEKYDLDGYEILSADYVNGLSTKDLVGGRLMLEIEDLNAYNPASLADICDFCATTDTPLLIHFGKTLESVGQTVNKFGVSPASLLEEYGLLDRECYLYGMNYIDKDDQILLASYNPTLILAPRSDAQQGCGEINLYNLIYNRLKFCFSSGKCYNIDMLGEALLAKQNTNNLMKKTGLIQSIVLLDALCVEEGDLMVEFDTDKRFDLLFEERFSLKNEQLSQEKMRLEDKIKEIATKFKGEN